MIRRLTLDWSGRRSSGSSGPTSVRLLAVSDEREAALEEIRNRQAIEPVDVIVGCGDLEPDYLSFLGDAFRAPLLYVRGNHDQGGAWDAAHQEVPEPLAGGLHEAAGLSFAGLGWPSRRHGRAERDDTSAWQQAISVYLRLRLRGARPDVVLSHVPPRGVGDIPADPYHRGFAAYRWLCRRLSPVLWLHGHTTMAAAKHWRTELDGTTLVNVTGAALIELQRRPRSPGPA
ncbi:MAG TPA: metallophosphoesterase [Candidatus Limnocylindria bacterium]|nr:metallophosphoesterase [Candidatus Limnocylindria bacterium]